MAQQISAADFQEKVLSADKPVLVDFFATWCGPCKMMAPVIEEVAAEMDGKAYVYQLDIDESMDIARGPACDGRAFRLPRGCAGIGPAPSA